MISAIAVAGVGFLVLVLLDAMMMRDPEQFRDVTPAARSIITWRWAFPVLALPAVAASVIALRVPRTRPMLRWLVVLGASAWLCALVIALVAVFIATIAPLYTYQPL